jgi:hypothetical protein
MNMANSILRIAVVQCSDAHRAVQGRALGEHVVKGVGEGAVRRELIMKQLTYWSSALLVAVSSLMCRTPEPAPATKPADVPTEHWIQSDELQVVMRKLNAAASTHWPSRLADDSETPISADEREDAFRRAAQLATALSESARQISDAVRDRNLSDADRMAFAGKAQSLSDQAWKLGQAARRRQLEEMQLLLDTTIATCVSCHTRFKDISGDLPPRA